jgi:hypothetical protein
LQGEQKDDDTEHDRTEGGGSGTTVP